MEKQVVVFDKVDPKKHSVRFDSSEESPAVSSIYISKLVLGGSVPKKIKVTIEEVK